MLEILDLEPKSALQHTLTFVINTPPYLAWWGGFGLSAGVPWGVDFLLLLRLALGGGFRLSAGLPGGFAFAN